MIIVTGVFTVDPADRDDFVAARVPQLLSTRQEAGCLEYTMAADPADAGRVVLIEKWEDEPSLEAHAAALKDNPPPPGGPRPTSISVIRYDVTGEKSLF